MWNTGNEVWRFSKRIEYCIWFVVEDDKWKIAYIELLSVKYKMSEKCKNNTQNFLFYNFNAIHFKGILSSCIFALYIFSLSRYFLLVDVQWAVGLNNFQETTNAFLLLSSLWSLDIVAIFSWAKNLTSSVVNSCKW